MGTGFGMFHGISGKDMAFSGRVVMLSFRRSWFLSLYLDS
jgi:hypothetical protein